MCVNPWANTIQTGKGCKVKVSGVCKYEATARNEDKAGHT